MNYDTDFEPCELCAVEFLPEDMEAVEMAAPPFGQVFFVCSQCAREQPIIRLIHALRKQVKRLRATDGAV